jgi:hypothetical protein
VQVVALILWLFASALVLVLSVLGLRFLTSRRPRYRLLAGLTLSFIAVLLGAFSAIPARDAAAGEVTGVLLPIGTIICWRLVTEGRGDHPRLRDSRRQQLSLE